MKLAASAAALSLSATGIAAAPDGAALYAENCASCHGAELEGQPNWRIAGDDGVLPAPPHDETGHTWHHPDSLLFDYTRLGGQEALRRMGVTSLKSGMPAFGGALSDEEIRAILDYIKSRWPAEIRDHQAGISRAAE